MHEAGVPTRDDRTPPTPWFLTLLAGLIAAVWAGVALNLLGSPAGIVGVVAFIALGAFVWKRTSGSPAPTEN